MKGRRGRERRGEVGKEGMVAGWFIACKTPEAGHHIMEAGKSLHCIEAKKLPGCVWKNQQQQHNDLEIPLELSINKCTYQYPFFRNNHYYEDSPNLSSSKKKTSWAVHHIIGAGKSLHCIEAKKILITVNVGVIRMWRCKSN